VARTTKVSKDTAAKPAKKPTGKLVKKAVKKPAGKPAPKPTAKKAPARKPAAKKPVKAPVTAAATAAAADVVKETKATPVAEATKKPQPGKSVKPKADKTPVTDKPPAAIPANAKAKPEAAKPAPAKDKPEPPRADLVTIPEEPDPAPEKTSVMPMVLGGVAAAAIGFGAAMFIQPKPTGIPAKFEQSLKQQDAALTALKSDVAALSGGFDASAIEAAQADNTAAIGAISGRMDAIEGQLGALNARLIKLEDRTIEAGSTDAANAGDIAALRTALADQKAQLEAIAATAAEQDKIANADARATLRRAALTRVRTALDSGAGFAPALADLEATGVTIPAALTAISRNGVVSLGQLQQSFPGAARAALAAARKASPETGEGGFTAFLRDQLGARSLEPQAGNDPDAILSRVEAATREDRLNDALAELQALPEVARIELSDWAGDVARRLEALAAAEQLGGDLN
jgi:hypothetical protein